MTEYRKTAVLFGPEGVHRGAPIEFYNRLNRDMFWCDFDKAIEGASDGTGIWRTLNIGAPTNPAVGTGYDMDTLLSGTIGFVDPGTAAAGSGVHVFSHNAVLPTISREFEFGYATRFRNPLVANAFAFVGMGGVAGAALNSSGVYINTSGAVGLLLEADRELRLRAGSGVNQVIKTGVLDDTWFDLEMRGSMQVSAAQQLSGTIEIYVDGVLVRTLIIGTGGAMSAIDIAAIGAWTPTMDVTRLAGATSLLQVDYVGRWFTRR